MVYELSSAEATQILAEHVVRSHYPPGLKFEMNTHVEIFHNEADEYDFKVRITVVQCTPKS